MLATVLYHYPRITAVRTLDTTVILSSAPDRCRTKPPGRVKLSSNRRAPIRLNMPSRYQAYPNVINLKGTTVNNRFLQCVLKRTLFILAVTAISTAANSQTTCRTDSYGKTSCDNGKVSDNKGNDWRTIDGVTYGRNGDVTRVDDRGYITTRHADGTYTTCRKDDRGVTSCW